MEYEAMFMKNNEYYFATALIYISDRWHLHAFCYQVGDWRDFVLSRILEVQGGQPARFDWLKTGFRKEIKRSTFVPHPELTDDQKQVVSFEFGMEDGKLEVEMTENELFYFRERYVANPGEGPPQKLLSVLGQA